MNRKLDNLLYAINNGIINPSLVEEQIKMTKREKYIRQHLEHYKKWKGANGYWYTYLPDVNKGRILKKKKTELDLDNAIVEYYQEKEESPTMRELFYLCYNEKVDSNAITESSFTRYENIFNEYYKNTEFESMHIQNVTEHHLYEFIISAVQEKKPSAKNYALFRTVTSGILKYAKRYNLTQISASIFFQDIDLSKKSFSKNHIKDADDVYTEKECELIKNYVESHPTIRNLCNLVELCSGERVGEVVALKPEDINIAGQEIHVHRTEQCYKDRFTHKRVNTVSDTTKTENGNTFVYVKENVIQYLLYAMELSKGDEFIFSENGNRIKAHAARKNLERLCKKINIPYRSPHKLRKTYATEMENKRVPKRIQLEQMGHADIKTTSLHYHRNNIEPEIKKEILKNAISF